MPGNKVFVISTTVTFSLLKNFTLLLWKKFLKKINKKTTDKTFKKSCYFSLPLFYTDCQFIQIATQRLQKQFVSCFQMSNFVFKLFKKQQKSNIQRPVM